MKRVLDKNSDYYKIIKGIIEAPEFIKRKNYRHHGEISVYEHSISVSMVSYLVAQKINIQFGKQIFNEVDVAVGGILHDFYYNDYTKDKTKKPFFKQHGFVHAREALENSKIHFPEYLNKRIENIIVRHMFPLNIIPPKYKEAWLITMVDKYVSMEVFPYLCKKLVRRIVHG